MEMSINSLVSKYGIRHEGVEYLIRLIDKSGFQILEYVTDLAKSTQQLGIKPILFSHPFGEHI